jgi:hypothetical protein
MPAKKRLCNNLSKIILRPAPDPPRVMGGAPGGGGHEHCRGFAPKPLCIASFHSSDDPTNSDNRRIVPFNSPIGGTIGVCKA